MEDEDGADSLSQRPPRIASLMATKAHPQRELLFKAIHPSDTLEEWMEKGLHRLEEDGEVWLEGFLKLPVAYSGCDKESLLIYAAKTQTQVYPIPLEITEENDGSRPPACRS
ncbi:unnamed protein product [Effrenium voratum]|uniref:Uncharacterized protein n=1 Tax=Effrenium voratum TaxID=2562239 RepID=A0AA36MS04_9DINO|nr:unnamed protein product [Effrenium voratum]CAJ1377027.1 unnamed protein product [Effrenium voratum]